jgi:FtsH-binding integral membrane protein
MNQFADVPIRQDLVPMVAGYALTMATLGLGMWLARTARPLVPEPSRRGWGSLIRRVVGTALGGYAVLMAVVLLYYALIARQGRGFLVSAFTGNAMLAFGIAVPALLAISYATDRLRRRASSKPP